MVDGRPGVIRAGRVITPAARIRAEPRLAIVKRREEEVRAQARVETEKKRLEEEQKRVQAEAKTKLQERVQVGGTSFTRQELQDAAKFAQKVIEGKPVTTNVGKATFDKLKSISAEFRREITKGIKTRTGLIKVPGKLPQRVSLKTLAEFRGFKSVKTFLERTGLEQKRLEKKLERERIKEFKERKPERITVTELPPEKKAERKAQVIIEKEDQPFIIERQTGTIKGTPVTKIFLVDPNTNTEREATSEEIIQFRKQFPDVGVVIPGETKSQKFKRLIEESTPEFKLIPKDLSKLIGFGFGTINFARDEAQNLLLNARDIEGKRIFTPNQARKTADFLFDTSLNLAGGAVAGKVFTIGRGAIVKGVKFVAPKLKEKPIIKKIASLLDVAVLSGLTIAETRRINKVFKEEGDDAAIRELIGTASFGVGFAKTGLKPSAQAEKEFEALTKILKKTVPPGKKAQAQLIRRKKKKGRFSELTEVLVSGEEVEKVKATTAAIEKRVAQAKNTQDQLRILADINRKLKTPEAKKNFQLFVEGLIEKNIVKLPNVDIIPLEAIKPSVTPRVPKPKAPLKPKIKEAALERARTPRQREIQRTQRQKTKEAERTKFSKQSLGERFKSAQKTLVKVSTSAAVVSAQRNLQSQKEKLKTLQKQGVTQKELQRQLEKLRTAQATVTKTVQRQLRKQRIVRVPRLGARPFKPIKIPKIPKVPPFPFAGKKGKRKVLTPLKKATGYNVFVKSRKKFIKANIHPIPKNKANDLGAWISDRTLSKQFRIKRTNRKAKIPKVNAPLNYFKTTQKKWRGKIVKGKEFPIKNRVIERNKAAIDTIGEKKKLRAAREIKRLQTKAKRKTSPPKFKKIKSLIKGK